MREILKNSPLEYSTNCFREDQDPPMNAKIREQKIKEKQDTGIN